MEVLYNKYENIKKFITDYRKYELEKSEKFLDFDEFKNQIQLSGYIKHNITNPKNDEKICLILFKKNSKFIKNTADFLKILNKFKKEIHLILITKVPISIYIKKAIQKHIHIKYNNYLHKYFIIELNKGPLCSKHSILSVEETKKVCFDIMSHGHKLPAITIDDPQNIWIGGEINDVIKIESYSEITGLTIKYRIVIPSLGRTVNNNQLEV